MKCLRLCFFGLIVLCGWIGVMPSQSQAQGTDPSAFQVQRFRPWGDPQGMWQTQSAQALGQWGYTAGIFLNYAYRPLSGPDTNKQNIGLIEHQIAADIVAGIGFLSWLELYLNIPLTLYQIGTVPNLSSSYGNLASTVLDGFYLGDIKLGLKFRALDETKHGVSLGFQVFVGLPTTAPTPFTRKHFNGEDPVSVGGMVILSRKISIAHLAFNLGYRFNPATALANVTISHELFYSLATSIEVVQKRLDIIGDFHGAVNLENTSVRNAPFELDLGVRFYPMSTKSLALNLGVGVPLTTGAGTPLFRVLFGLIWSPEKLPDTDGDGITDDKDRCPKTPGPRENQGCPWPDSDGDGLTDNIDKCPKEPGPRENNGCPWADTDGDGLTDNIDKCPQKPGPRENNGCPWPDTDGDGLTDNIDKCPQKPGPRENNGCPWPDTDGDGLTDNIDKCPKDPGPKSNFGCPLAIMKQTKIEITQRIFFDFNRDTIKVRSYPVLDAVVAILQKHNRVSISIEGHTDDVGTDAYNLDLSRRRARAVRNYLVQKGISKKRLTFKGFGKSTPLESGKSEEARAKNRRVEFVITKQ